MRFHKTRCHGDSMLQTSHILWSVRELPLDWHLCRLWSFCRQRGMLRLTAFCRSLDAVSGFRLQHCKHLCMLQPGSQPPVRLALTVGVAASMCLSIQMLCQVSSSFQQVQRPSTFSLTLSASGTAQAGSLAVHLERSNLDLLKRCVMPCAECLCIALRHCFVPSSAFWTAHCNRDGLETPFFSYLCPLVSSHRWLLDTMIPKALCTNV